MTPPNCYAYRRLSLQEARLKLPILERAVEAPPGQSPWMPVTDMPCWMWQGWTDVKGYAKTRWGGNSDVRVHRLTYEVFRRALDASEVLDHRCRNRACVNPWHLEPIDVGENTRRGARASGWCRNGLHLMTPANLIVRYRDGLPRYECKACKEARRRKQ
jgi:hypothetical protein